MMIMQCVKEVVLLQQTKGNFHLDWQVQSWTELAYREQTEVLLQSVMIDAPDGKLSVFITV